MELDAVIVVVCNFSVFYRYTTVTKKQNTMETLIKSDIRVVAIDETRHWDRAIQNVCGTIKTVYMYDSSVVTHCCEITPSYHLTPLYYVIENEVSDEVWEMVNENLVNEEPKYMHCHVVDELESIASEQELDFEDSESEEYKDHFEEVREYLNGNHLI